MSVFETSPTSDIAAERAVLAEVMLDDSLPNGTLARFEGQGITEETFYDPRHGVIWQAIIALRKSGRGIDVLTLCAELRAMGRINTIGGAQYIGELTDEIPTLAHCESHGATIVEFALLRKGIAIGNDIVATGNAPEPVSERLAKMNALSLKVPSGVQSNKDVSLLDRLAAALEGVDKMNVARAHGAIVTARFGVEALDGSSDGRFDGMLNGIHRRNVLTIAAPPGGGKTTLMMQAAIVSAQDALAAANGDGKKSARVVIFSAEMTGPDVALRLACSRACIDYNRHRAGRANQLETDRLYAAVNEIAELPIDIIDSETNNGALTASSIYAYLVGMRANGKVCALAGVDYFQQLDRTRGNEKLNETEEQKDRAKILVKAAKDGDAPMIVISSITKSGQRDTIAGKPGTHDTSGAGLDFASDTVMFLVPINDDENEESSEKKGKFKKKPRDIGEVPAGCIPTEVNITKNRYGPTGAVTILFDKPRGMFCDTRNHRSGALPDSLPDDLANSNVPDTYSDMAGLEPAPWEQQE